MENLNLLLDHLEEARSQLAKANDLSGLNRKRAKKLRNVRESVHELIRELEETEQRLLSKA